MLKIRCVLASRVSAKALCVSVKRTAPFAVIGDSKQRDARSHGRHSGKRRAIARIKRYACTITRLVNRCWR
jgi:hypothetical protein